MSTSPATTKVPVHVANGNAFVWSVRDASVLRSEHRICGVLAGTLPQAAQQNLFLGLPLLLLPEEVVLLLSNELAYLVDDPASHATPTVDQLATWNASRKASASYRSDIPKGAPPPPLSDAALKKRLERQKRKEAQVAALRQAQEAHEAALDSGALMPPPPEPEVREAPAGAKEAASYIFRIPAASDEFSWYEEKAYHTVQEARDAGVWTYPSNSEERAKCAVFADLWRKGYYMGNGLRFGGDWLVYPGDPLRYHSHFVATVYASPSTTIQPMEIVAHGRLGTATKKSHLLCGWDESTNQVSYISVEWAGFG